jgi:hypothetical protein
VQVALGDRGDCAGTIELAGTVTCDRFPPDRAPNREAAEPFDLGGDTEPVLNPLVDGAPTQDQAADVVATPSPTNRREPLTVGAPVESLDLPHRRLHAAVLDLGHRVADERRSQLEVEALGIVADPAQLPWRRRDEQLEQELAIGVA